MKDAHKQAAHLLLDAALLKVEQREQARREMRELETAVTPWNAKETRRRLAYREERIADLEEERDSFAAWLETILDGDDLDGLDDIVEEARNFLVYYQRKNNGA